MNIKDHCEMLRGKILQLEAEVRMLIGSAGNEVGALLYNAVLALHHLEESRARLGQVIQGHDVAQGAMSAAHMPAPMGSETHPLDKTVEGEIAMSPKEPMPEPPVVAAPEPDPVVMHPHNAPDADVVAPHNSVNTIPHYMPPAEGADKGLEEFKADEHKDHSMPPAKHEDKEGDVNA